jgi:hypothetical protein
MSTVISRLVLVLTYFLFATYAIAEVEVSWGNVPDRSRVYVSEGDGTFFANVCFENRVTVSSRTQTHTLVYKGVNISIYLEHGDDQVPDAMTVLPVPGYRASALTITVNENENGCIQLEEYLLG